MAERIHLNGFDRHQLEKWLMDHEAEIPTMTVWKAIARIKAELGIVVTKPHVDKARRDFKIAATFRVKRKRRKVIRPDLTFAIADAVVTISQKLGIPVDDALVQYIREWNEAHRNGEAVSA